MVDHSPSIVDGIYSWWTQPISIEDGDYTWVGSIGAGVSGVLDQLNRVHRVNRVSGVVDEIVLEGETAPDDHNGVALALDTSQTDLLAFYARHDNDSFVRLQRINRTTLVPDSLETIGFGSVVTYVQILQSSTGTLWLITRTDADDTWVYRTSVDWGVTWDDTRTLLVFTGYGSTYLSARPDRDDRDTVRLVVGPWPPNTTHKIIHYATIDLTSGDISAADATVIGDFDAVGGPALTPDDLEIVIDPGSDRTRTLDVGVVDGQPAVAYATWVGEDGDPTYRIRRWNGSAWVQLDWGPPSGPEFGYLPSRRYVGGVVFGLDGVLWTSRKEIEEWVIDQWTWDDDTGTFVFAEEAARSSVRLIRPRVPWNAPTSRVVYQRVDQYSSTSTSGYSGGIVVLSASVPIPPPPPAVEVIEPFVGLPHYRYVFGQAKSGLITAEIPLYGVSMNTVLNAGSDFTGTFQMDMSGFRNQDLVNATDPGRTFVVVERDGFPIWDGNVIARVYQAQSKSMQVFARSLSAYPSKVKIDAGYYPNGFVFEDTEQTEVFLDLWETLQSVSESDLRVEIPEPLETGINITINVQPYEDKYFGQVMDEICNGIQGFDWRIITRKIDNVYTRVLQLGYPTIGMSDHNRLVFEYPGPMMNYWRTHSLSESGTHIHGLGSGQGEDMLRADVIHTDLIDAGYLRYDYDEQYKDVTNQELLDSLTNQVSVLKKATRPTYTVQMKGDQEPEFGTYLPGDACILKFEDPAHPNGLRFETRVIGWRLTPPSSDSVEMVSLHFEGGEEGGF